MKKIITSLFLVVFGVVMLNITKASVSNPTLPPNCLAYSDWCNQCARGDVNTSNRACTMKACLDQKEPVYTCTAFADTWAIQEPVMCTMQYEPVCGEVAVQCVTAPCEPVKQTFGNSCVLGATKNATYLYDGECKAEDMNEPIACTKEYMPMCGEIAGKQQTYGNMCMLRAAKAQILYAWECKVWLEAGEWSAYSAVAKILDASYLAWEFTPIQAHNYTQTIIDKIDTKLQTSRMKKWAYERHIQLKRFLQTYMTIMHITK